MCVGVAGVLLQQTNENERASAISIIESSKNQLPNQNEEPSRLHYPHVLHALAPMANYVLRFIAKQFPHLLDAPVVFPANVPWILVARKYDCFACSFTHLTPDWRIETLPSNYSARSVFDKFNSHRNRNRRGSTVGLFCLTAFGEKLPQSVCRLQPTGIETHMNRADSFLAEISGFRTNSALLLIFRFNTVSRWLHHLHGLQRVQRRLRFSGQKLRKNRQSADQQAECAARSLVPGQHRIFVWI